MADASYETEVKVIKEFLRLQKPDMTASMSLPADIYNDLDLEPENCVAPRFLGGKRARQFALWIAEAHTRVKDRSLMEAKLSYIRAWQALPDYGVTYFVIHQPQSKKKVPHILGFYDTAVLKCVALSLLFLLSFIMSKD
jgi:kindlin 2